jgi:hypothetical protein
VPRSATRSGTRSRSKAHVPWRRAIRVARCASSTGSERRNAPSDSPPMSPPRSSSDRRAIASARSWCSTEAPSGPTPLPAPVVHAGVHQREAQLANQGVERRSVLLDPLRAQLGRLAIRQTGRVDASPHAVASLQHHDRKPHASRRNAA